MKNLKYSSTQREEAPPSGRYNRFQEQEFSKCGPRKVPEWKSTASLNTLGSLPDIFFIA